MRLARDVDDHLQPGQNWREMLEVDVPIYLVEITTPGDVDGRAPRLAGEVGTSPAMPGSIKMKISPDHLLLKCTQCQAWPMAIIADDGDRLAFRCEKCRAQEAYSVGVAGRLIPAAGGLRTARYGRSS